jgi:DNA polymerase III alpha subunit (gram-positive type)
MAFPDVMVDIETTGTSPDEAAIIQIAAVRFNLAEKTIDSADMFNRCLAIAPKRYWSEDTREWWMKQKRSVLLDILAQGESPATVMWDFAAWARAGEAVHFWAKPISFDYTFCASYFNQFEVSNPFHFRNAIDMNSFVRGLGRSNVKPDVEVDFAGDAHNAIFDVLNQIAVLFKAVETVQ